MTSESGDRALPAGLPDWLDASGRSYAATLSNRGIALPSDVPFVRYVGEQERTEELIGVFFAEAGIDRRPGPDASTQERDEFEVASALAWYRCCASYPLHPRYRPYTEEQIRLLYDYYVDRLVPCLLSEGYDVGPAPSWEYFLANYHTPNRWNPYWRVPIPNNIAVERGVSTWQTARNELERRCPPAPPDEGLYPLLKIRPDA